MTPMAPARPVTVATVGRVAVITINRPARRNALDRRTALDLSQLVGAATSTDAVRAIVVTGAGDRAFCAGADLTEIGKRSAHDALEAVTSELFLAIERSPKPTIAAINGAARGGGGGPGP